MAKVGSAQPIRRRARQQGVGAGALKVRFGGESKELTPVPEGGAAAALQPTETPGPEIESPNPRKQAYGYWDAPVVDSN